MQYKLILWVLTLVVTTVLFAGCSRGDVAQNGVNPGENVSRSSDMDQREENLYEDDDLFMDDVEEGIDDAGNMIEEGVDDTADALENGVDAVEDGMDNDHADDMTRTSGR